MLLCFAGTLLRNGLEDQMFKRFLCWIRWHSWSYDTTEFDGCPVHSKCKWCGYEGMIDSQGNLF